MLQKDSLVGLRMKRRSPQNVIKYALACICLTSFNTTQATEIEPEIFAVSTDVPPT
ncbi:MAG TPA: hypothetical protein VN448_00810 [Gammaproteobacteria bacterium]|jgi:hypothetical protein|nr:hypothetical protein [Gammaproteobacteria bacterium]